MFHMFLDAHKIWNASRVEKIAWKNVAYTPENWTSVAVSAEQWLEAYGHTTLRQWARLHLERRLRHHNRFELPPTKGSVLEYAERFGMTRTVDYVAEAVAVADFLNQAPGEARDAFVEAYAKNVREKKEQSAP
jgi:hypothetical protein